MNEQEARAFAQEIEKTFPGTVTYLDHYEANEKPDQVDHWRVWVSREKCDKFYHCKEVTTFAPGYFPSIKKEIRILTGLEV